MTPRNLLVSAWTGGLITLGGAVTALVLAPGASSALPGEPGLLSLVGALIALILVLSALGWFIGARLGEAGTIFFIMISAMMWAMALKEIDSLTAALLCATVAIGPFFTGWVLGLLAASRREGAEDQNKISAWLLTDLGGHGATPRRLLVAAWVGGLVTLGSAGTGLILAPGASSPLPGEPGLLSLVGLLIALILILSALGWFIGIQPGHMSPIFFIFISTCYLAFALREFEGLQAALLGSTLAIGPLLTGWSLGGLRALRRQAAAGQD